MKRTALHRITPLPRGNPPQRRTELRSVTRLVRHVPLVYRPTRRTVVQARAAADERELLWLRAGRRCEASGRPVGFDVFDDHHRLLKAHGRDDRLSNRMCLHPDAHTGGPNAVHRIGRTAYDLGWLVRSTEDPAEVKVLVWGVGWRLLSDDGEYLEVAA